ncbi:MAG: hypothetical protein WAK95_08690 [Desulfobacterales bacterium]
MDFLADLRTTGFVEVASAGETGFNSSPKTRGMLVRARKPGLQNRKTSASSKTNAKHVPPDAEGSSTKMSSKIDTLLQRAILLGAEKTKLIDTDSIVVENGISLRWCLSNRSSGTRRSSLWRPCYDGFLVEITVGCPYIDTERPRIFSPTSFSFQKRRCPHV